VREIDKITLFNIFESSHAEEYQENEVYDLLHNTYILLGMTIKGVENYSIMEQMYDSRYQESFATVRDSIKIKYFTRLIRYLERIDLSQLDTLYELKDLLGEQSINYALTEMIEFFEEVEMYENCALLMQFYKVFFPKNSWKSQD
jgi:hypothetical protein